MNRRLLLWITFGVSAALIIAGFLLPPLGIIDNSGGEFGTINFV
jgi:hypothetical protein